MAEKSKRAVRRKPKFEIGEVVAWCPASFDKPSAYYQIASFFFDEDDAIRYTFRVVDGVSASLCPIEECVRSLNSRELGPRKRKVKS